MGLIQVASSWHTARSGYIRFSDPNRKLMKNNRPSPSRHPDSTFCVDVVVFLSSAWRSHHKMQKMRSTCNWIHVFDVEISGHQSRVSVFCSPETNYYYYRCRRCRLVKCLLNVVARETRQSKQRRFATAFTAFVLVSMLCSQFNCSEFQWISICVCVTVWMSLRVHPP